MVFSTIGGAGGGSAETPSGGAGSAEHAGVEDNSSSNADQIQINDTSVVINKDLDDVDFQVKGDTAANLLYCDASTDRVGIGLNDPNVLLHVEANPPVIALGSTGSNDPRINFYDSGTTDIGATIFFDQSSDTMKFMRTLSGSATDGISIVTNGDVGVGTITPDAPLEVSKASADAEVLISCYHDTGSTTPKITFRKGDGSEASPALVDDDDVLGTIDFLGHDGVNFERGAKIEARIQGAAASNDLPTELTFWTTPDGSNTAAERMSIGADGGVALKSLASAPSATADYTKIYALAGGEAIDIQQAAAKGWIAFDGTSTVAITDSYNVSSLADDGTGSYTISWATDFADANYCCAGMCEDLSYGGTLSVWDDSSKAAGTLKIATHSKDTQTDADIAMVVAFGNQ